MAPAIYPAKRTTRSSTRSQTVKSRDDVSEVRKPARTEGPGGIDKHRAKATDKATRLPKSGRKQKHEPKPNLNSKSKSEPSITASRHDSKPNTSKSTPSNMTTLTVDTSLVKSPVICHEYAPTSTTPSTDSPPTFIFTHGAGGGVSAPAVVHFCTGFSSTSTSPLLAFQGSMNLGGRVKGFHACYAHAYGDVEVDSKLPAGKAKTVVFGGRSMGARAAVMAATELDAEVQKKAGGQASLEARLVLVSYPLQGPKDVRDQILFDLPKDTKVLFIIGDRDAMCPLELLEKTRAKMKVKSRVVVVKGADHGMNVKPAKKTKELGEESGRVAARWLNGDIKTEGDTLFVGDGE